jgi:hypothetical protein
MVPRSFQIRISGPKIWSAPTKTDLPYNFCFLNFLPSLTVEAVDSPQTLFRAPDPWFRVKARSRRSRPDQVDYWEGVLHILHKNIVPENDWLWLQKHMGPRSFQLQISGPKIWSAPTKTDLSYNFCFIKFLPSLTVADEDALQTLFRAPCPRGSTPGAET